MKIELTVEGAEPTLYKLTKAKTLIGSAEDCDVVLTAKGISRKHLAVLVEDDQFFVVDQGSANGTFVNDERLVPGERTQFTSFFPLRLAGEVTLTLLSEDEGGAPKFDFASSLPKTESSAPKPRPKELSGDATTPTRILERGSARTPIRKEGPAKSSRAAARQADQALMFKTKILAFLVVAAGVGFFFWTQGPEEVATPVDQVVVAAKPPEPKLSQSLLTPPMPATSAFLSSAVTDLKCGGEIKEICDALKLPSSTERLAGALVTFSSIVLVLPQLTATEVLAEFAGDYKWDEKIREKWPAEIDQRELAILSLLRLPPTAWDQFTADRRWLYVGFIKDSQLVGGYYVLDGLSLKTRFQGGEKAGLLSNIQLNPHTTLFNLSGYLRRP